MFPFFFFNDTATTEIYTLSLHDALPISAHDNDALAAHGADHVVPRLGELGDAADADPTPREDTLPLFGPNLGRVVVAPGQRALALLIRLGGFDERRHRA